MRMCSRPAVFFLWQMKLCDANTDLVPEGHNVRYDDVRSENDGNLDCQLVVSDGAVEVALARVLVEGP